MVISRSPQAPVDTAVDQNVQQTSMPADDVMNLTDDLSDLMSMDGQQIIAYTAAPTNQHGPTPPAAHMTTSLVQNV